MLAQWVFFALLTSAIAHAQLLSGRIVEDHTNTPLPSVNVRVARPGEKFLAADLETDREGLFQATLPAGNYRLEIARPGYTSTKMPITLPAAGVNTTVRLVKLGVISGRALDQQNQPVASATLSALPKPPGGQPVRPPSGFVLSATSNSRGEYRIHDVPPGEYYVVASLGASTRAMGSAGMPATSSALGSQFVYYPNNTRPDALTFAGGEDLHNIDFNILIGALFRVSGKVDPKPDKTYFVVGLVNPDRPALAVAVAEAKEDGTFQFTGIPAGSYKLVAASSARARNGLGFLLATQPIFGVTSINVSTMDVGDIVIAPNASRTATFELKPSGGCPAAAKLDLIPLEEWGSRLNRSIDLVAGQPATITDLAPARYALSPSATASACYLAAETILDLSGSSPSGAIIVAFAPAAEVRGRLDAGGRSPGDFSIVLISAEGAQSFELGTPDREGRFSFSGLRPGRYRMGAFPVGQRLPDATKMFEFEVRGGSNAEIDLVAPLEVKQ
jgi:hypothetical protein